MCVCGADERRFSVTDAASETERCALAAWTLSISNTVFHLRRPSPSQLPISPAHRLKLQEPPRLPRLPISPVSTQHPLPAATSITPYDTLSTIMSLFGTFPGSSRPAAASAPKDHMVGHQFSPYDSNGGSIAAVCGTDFCVVASDTRQSTGYNIQTRYKPKVFRLNDKATLATNGFAADAEALVSHVRQRLEMYRHAHGRSMPLHSIARMISTILYGKRFFPYYVYNILGGLDEEGKGAVYSFDPVGSYEREFCRAAGAAQSLIQPFFDNQIMFRNQTSTPERTVPTPGQMTLPEVLKIVVDSFTSATERHIEVGDGLEVFVVRTPGARAEGEAAKGAAAVDLSSLPSDVPFSVAEAVGGEDEQQQGAVMVIRRELKKD